MSLEDGSLKIMGKIEVWSSWSFRREKLGSLNRAMWMIKNKCLISMQVKVLGTDFFLSLHILDALCFYIPFG